tara:strand:+ start:1406 stop:1675 length:270 start_codon:yes stop_codon:yes gene_type:complete
MGINIYMCRTCHQGFDISISKGIECPECGNRLWTKINKLPSFAEKYREQWAQKYGIMLCDDEDDITARRRDWEAAEMKSDGMTTVSTKE